eukprot:7794660-Ditylum_brightwellii.AAC.1
MIGTWRGTKYNIELQEGAKPYHRRPYSVPKVYGQSFRLEVEQLEKIGVLCKVNRLQWGAPTFVIPKKDKTIQFITDFWELNKRINQRPYPLPKIQDSLLGMEGF